MKKTIRIHNGFKIIYIPFDEIKLIKINEIILTAPDNSEHNVVEVKFFVFINNLWMEFEAFEIEPNHLHITSWIEDNLIMQEPEDYFLDLVGEDIVYNLLPCQQNFN